MTAIQHIDTVWEVELAVLRLDTNEEVTLRFTFAALTARQALAQAHNYCNLQMDTDRKRLWTVRTNPRVAD